MQTRDVKKFIDLLDEKITLGINMLIERYNYINKQDPASATFMYENKTMAGFKNKVEDATKHGTLALGQIGIAETLQILLGCNHTKPEGMELAKEIEKLFYYRCKHAKEQYGLNIGVYYTPAEGLCYTALNNFKKKWGVIENVSDKKFFTNSMHIPVWEKVDAFTKIDLESELTGYSNSGCITYVEMDASIRNNLKALEKIVLYAKKKDIPYFAVNVPNDSCNECGFMGDFNDCCPACGSENVQRLRRVTGYITSDYKTSFNAGKQDEVEHRVKHTGVLIDE